MGYVTIESHRITDQFIEGSCGIVLMGKSTVSENSLMFKISIELMMQVNSATLRCQP